MFRCLIVRVTAIAAAALGLLTWGPALVQAATPAKLFDIANPFGGSSANDGFGHAVAPAGDWNGDGYADMIVGFDENIGNGTSGRAAIYFGGPHADATQDVLFFGEGIDDAFGYSVTGLGDFNQDGYDDVAVGAPWHNTNQADAGAVYVFYGGPFADNLYDMILAPNATGPGRLRGYSISSAGDFNGDGVPDLLVGVPDTGPGGLGNGRAEIYLGGSPPSGTIANTLVVPGANLETNGTCTGTAVHEAGDINGDGYGDVLVGTSSSPWLDDDPGRAGIFFGGPTPPAPIFFIGEQPLDDFGASVSGGGDFNADGRPDIVISAPENDAGAEGGGRVYVYDNGPTFDTNPDMVLTGGTPFQRHGHSVSLTSSLDGDLDAELLVSDTDRYAFVFFGGTLADPIAEFVIYMNQPTVIGGIGDFSGDGLGDFAIGRPTDTNDGGVSVYAGIPLMVKLPKPGQQVYTNTPTEVVWNGVQAADMYYSSDGGSSWAMLRSNVGGNETNRLLVRLPAVQTTHARLRLVAAGESVSMGNFEDTEEFSVLQPWTPPSPIDKLAGTTSGGASGDRLGYAVASADVNGDGYGDRVVGAPFQGGGGGGAGPGRVTIYLGGPGADDIADVTMSGQADGDQFGSAVASAGDVNGDGYDDVLVGSKGNDNAGPEAGKVDLFLGGPVMDSGSDVTFQADNAGESFGACVAGAGDLNGDGYDDIVIGAPLSFTGHLKIYFGGRTVDNLADRVVSGDGVGEQFGFALAGGDLNGDGFSDIAVGAPLFSNNTGHVYVYFGGINMDRTADLQITGTPGSQFGYSLAVADFSGDGPADLTVGARMGNFEVSMGNFESGVSLGNFESGVGYVYYGGSAFDDRADVAMQGERTGDQFGFAVAAAGDVNGDRYQDLVIGAPNAAACGRAYLFLGGPGPDGTADRVLTGANPGDFFGSAVASAGDARGDEFADLLIGAQLQSSSAGAARLYDMNRYFLTTPAPGDLWNVGALRTVSWRGAEPADVLLSVDGGHTYAVLESSVGGAENNSISIRVPHQPSKFARIKIAPHAILTTGSGAVDGNFTIQTSVALLALLAAPRPEGGAVVTWHSDPGPEDLAGYRLERAAASGPWQTAAPLLTETRYDDPGAAPGTRYRLFAVNGLSEELMLGETSLPMARRLAAWPMPYRGGAMSISFATGSGLAGVGAPAEVSLFDVRGRLVRTLAKGNYRAGYQRVSWDGRDAGGRDVAAGVYFLRAQSAGEETTVKLTVLR